jgi:putative SOS response-associated peptidase YedK
MCGRFTLTADVNKIRENFPGVDIPDAMQKKYNVAPTQPVAVIPNDGKNKLDFYVWGLIPSWAKDPAIGNRMINARAETLIEKPSYRAAFRRRRCLVLADGFYEWRVEGDGKRKTPMYIRMEGGEPFAFAGLWETWQSPDSSVIPSCTIITTEPNNLMSSIHNRMPVILPRSVYSQWLAPGDQDPTQLLDLLQPYPDEHMTAYPISRLVNDPRNDVPDCILPLAGD